MRWWFHLRGFKKLRVGCESVGCWCSSVLSGFKCSCRRLCIGESFSLMSACSRVACTCRLFVCLYVFRLSLLSLYTSLFLGEERATHIGVLLLGASLHFGKTKRESSLPLKGQTSFTPDPRGWRVVTACLLHWKRPSFFPPQYSYFSSTG